MPKVDFRQFQEFEAQNDDSLAKVHIQRRCVEAVMVVAYHLGGLVGVEWSHALGWKNDDMLRCRCMRRRPVWPPTALPQSATAKSFTRTMHAPCAQHASMLVRTPKGKQREQREYHDEPRHRIIWSATASPSRQKGRSWRRHKRCVIGRHGQE